MFRRSTMEAHRHIQKCHSLGWELAERGGSVAGSRYNMQKAHNVSSAEK
jgi:hypothetical protein